MERQQAKTIDERFDDVTQAFLDQRDFTIFVHDKLNTRLDKIGRRLDKMDGRLGRIELVMSEVLNEVKAFGSR